MFLFILVLEYFEISRSFGWPGHEEWRSSRYSKIEEKLKIRLKPYCFSPVKISTIVSPGNQITLSITNYEKVDEEWSTSLNNKMVLKSSSLLENNHFFGRKKDWIDSITNYLFSVSCDSGEIKHLLITDFSVWLFSKLALLVNFHI